MKQVGNLNTNTHTQKYIHFYNFIIDYFHTVTNNMQLNELYINNIKLWLKSYFKEIRINSIYTFTVDDSDVFIFTVD